MSGTYLVCDVCGKFGPPAAFVGKEGVRLCYQCAYSDEQENVKGQEKTRDHDKQEPENSSR